MTPFICLRGLTTTAANSGTIVHLEASSWQVQAGQILKLVAREAQVQASDQAALSAERSQLLAVVGL